MAWRLPWIWGATASEAASAYPCDRFAAPGSRRIVRAVTVEAPIALCFLWLCQLKRAPYSYDLLDNLGRKSPPRADPSLISLQPGTDMMTIFTLVEIVPDRSLTVRMKPGLPTGLFGSIALTYQLDDAGGRVRMIAAMTAPPIGVLGRFRRWLLAWGDLVMMRRQLHVLRGYAERDARAAR